LATSSTNRAAGVTSVACDGRAVLVRSCQSTLRLQVGVVDERPAGQKVDFDEFDATALRLRPSSDAISRWLLPRLCSKWTVLRSMSRNTLLPALLGWATVSGYDADLLSHFAVKAVAGLRRRARG
jgi:hypothetical protein